MTCMRPYPASSAGYNLPQIRPLAGAHQGSSFHSSSRRVNSCEIVEDSKHGRAELLDIIVELRGVGLHGTTDGIAHETIPLSGVSGLHGRLARGFPHADEFDA